jgi:hypothetical protein
MVVASGKEGGGADCGGMCESRLANVAVRVGKGAAVGGGDRGIRETSYSLHPAKTVVL